ncbi:MAG: hypothetical protein U0031_15305 [Thermomicrobiales bacterium]
MTQGGDFDENGITRANEEISVTNPRRLLGKRPLSMYIVLIAGIGVLAALVAVLIVTTRGDEPPPITCLPITVDEGESLIRDGKVARMSVLTVRGRPETGPIAVSMDLQSGSCRELPKGVAGQRDLYEAVGVVTVHNQSQPADNRIRIVWEEQDDIPQLLLATNTPTPTPAPPTSTPTETPPPTATAEPPTTTPLPPTATAAPATPTPAPTATPVPATRTPVPATAAPTRASATATPSRVPPTATRAARATPDS